MAGDHSHRGRISTFSLATGGRYPGLAPFTSGNGLAPAQTGWSHIYYTYPIILSAFISYTCKVHLIVNDHYSFYCEEQDDRSEVFTQVF
jgi:hypothetical protein